MHPKMFVKNDSGIRWIVNIHNGLILNILSWNTINCGSNDVNARPKGNSWGLQIKITVIWPF